MRTITIGQFAAIGVVFSIIGKILLAIGKVIGMPNPIILPAVFAAVLTLFIYHFAKRMEDEVKEIWPIILGINIGYWLPIALLGLW